MSVDALPEEAERPILNLCSYRSTELKAVFFQILLNFLINSTQLSPIKAKAKWAIPDVYERHTSKDFGSHS